MVQARLASKTFIQGQWRNPGELIDITGYRQGAVRRMIDRGIIFLVPAPQSPPGPEGPTDLDDLGDVDTAGQASGDVLAYDGSGWVVSGGYATQDGLAAALAETNLHLWQLDVDVIAETEGFAGWTGEAFLTGQDNVQSVVGDVSVARAARLGDGGLSIAPSPTAGIVAGTLTLNPVTLPAVSDTVYVLADEDLGTGIDAATSLYEASLDGGTTWETVTPGTLNHLAHTGSSLQVRVTLNLDDTSDQVGTVRWLVAYGTDGEVLPSGFSTAFPGGAPDLLVGAGFVVGLAGAPYARMWHDVNGSPVEYAAHPTGEVRSLAFAPDGSRLYYGRNSTPAALEVHDLTTDTLESGWPDLPAAVNGLSVSPDGELLAVGMGEDWRLIDTQTKTIVIGSPTISGNIYNVSFSPDGQRIAMAGDHGYTVIDRETLTVESGWPSAPGWCQAVAWLPDSSRLVIVQGDAPYLRCFVTADKSEETWPQPSGRPSSLAISPDMTRAAVARASTGLQVLDLTSMTWEDGWPSMAAPVAFSPDSSRLYAGLEVLNVSTKATELGWPDLSGSNVRDACWLWDPGFTRS